MQMHAHTHALLSVKYTPQYVLPHVNTSISGILQGGCDVHVFLSTSQIL